MSEGPPYDVPARAQEESATYRYERIREPLPYEEIRTLDFDSLPTGEAIDRIGQLVDDGLDHAEVLLLERALEQSTGLFRRGDIEPGQRSQLDYYVANAWNAIRILNPSVQTSLDDPEGTAQEIFHLRRAVNSDGFEMLSIPRRAQVLTNLGNTLSNVGRSIEALAYWEAALGYAPGFGMALGNSGYALLLYAWDVHDPHDRVLLLREARTRIEDALEVPLEGTADKSFEKTLQDIEGFLEVRDDPHIDFPEPVTSGNSDELIYRGWCAVHRLFLSPLNDIGSDASVMRDRFPVGPLTTSDPLMGPGYLGFLSQMKQEFVSARYLAFLGMYDLGPHHSDRFVDVADTLDYPSFSLSTERAKAAFRMAYSIFDKIAFFLNAYFQLGIEDHAVTFKTLWFEKQKPNRARRQELPLVANRPLAALYWLSRDLHEKKENVQAVMDPDARALAVLRNHLEHRYLKIHHEPWGKDGEGAVGVFRDSLAYSLSRPEFEDKLLRILHMSRCALIYLTQGVTRQERLRKMARREHSGGQHEAVPLHIAPLDDEWRL